MDSFYGGQQGISFIIKDKFDSIDDMNYCFSHGYYPLKNNSSDISQWTNDTTRPYDNVWYGQYCIIDTPNKNNIHNGKVFRRTAYNATHSANSYDYAEFIGQIVGPAGGVPKLELESLAGNETKFDTRKVEENSSVYYTSGYDTTNQTVIYDDDATGANLYNVSPGKAIYKSGKDYLILPSDDEEVITSDTPAFKYNFYNFKTEAASDQQADSYQVSTIGMGFEIPYVDFDDPTIELLAYGSTPSVQVTQPFTNNDFLYQYNFKIPGGLPGAHIGNLQSIQVLPLSKLNESSVIPGQEITFIKDGQTVTGTVTPNSQTIKIGDEYIDKSGQIIVDTNNHRYFFPPLIYDLTDVDYIPGRKTGTTLTEYKLKDEASPKTNFKSTFILASNFMYVASDTGEWVSGADDIDTTSGIKPIHIFYLADLPMIQNVTTSYITGSGYHLFVKYEGIPETSNQTNNTQETLEDYFDAGLTGPQYWGVWATKFASTYHYVPETRTLTPAPPPPTQDQGNLGVYQLEQADSTQSIFYIWTGQPATTTTPTPSGTWEAIGESTDDKVNIDIDGFTIKNQAVPAYFRQAEEPQSQENIDKFEDMPWK